MFDKLDTYISRQFNTGCGAYYALHFSAYPTPSPADLDAFLLVAFVAGVTANRLGR
jgi:hypothetical protein